MRLEEMLQKKLYLKDLGFIIWLYFKKPKKES